VGEISRGFCLFVGFTHDDSKERVEKMVNKLVSLRLFDDENGKTNLSLEDIGGSILSISQFTLYASLKDGRRPSFLNAMRPDEATKLYDYFNECLRKTGIHIETGVFGAEMKINLENNGPFTTILDSAELGL
jgi:D-tyrosyl-tRNA(Tyr) deacylase